MNNTEEIDILLSREEFQRLAVGLDEQAGPLSPFHIQFLTGAAGKMDPAALLEAPAGFERLVTLLSAPAAQVSLGAILGEQILDVSIYHASSRQPEDSLALSAELDQLRLQKPAPIDAIVGLLGARAGSAGGACAFKELELSPLAAWTWWACLDQLQAAPPENLGIPALRAHLEGSIQSMNGLASYAQEVLGLETPSEAAFMQGINQLIQKWILALGSAGSLTPAPWMGRLAQEFKAETSFVTLTASLLQPSGTPGMFRLFFIQPAGGSAVMWYENSETVTLLNLAPMQAVALIAQVLYEPQSFFLPGAGGPAPAR